MRFDNKVALITGAGGGIGRAIATRLSSEGASVCVADILQKEAEATASEIGRLGYPAISHVADMGDISVIPGMIEKVVSRFGRLDILINNAGVNLNKPLLEITEKDWERIISINQKGLFFCMQAAAKQMISQIPAEPIVGDLNVCNGKIINISSMFGRRGDAEMSVYASSKAAVISLTKSGALALAPYNINVNAVAPGIIHTAMLNRAIDELNRQAGKPVFDLEVIAKQIPLKRTGSADETAAIVAFLCSPEAEYITGQCLNIDGGMEMD